ncbi:MAG: hypothetical protein EAZ27_03150 [Cytophagales bacterium]|nr:MAG: hypothetical protein EAZ27_03150 [Cytophagales bacterium]
MNLYKGTPKNLNSDEALWLGCYGFVAEIGLGGVFENYIGVFRGSHKFIFIIKIKTLSFYRKGKNN